MKAADFRYERPETLPDALALLTNPEAAPLAGGQSLMPMMNFRLARPEVIVDLNRVAGLAGITATDETLHIGAMTRYAALEQSGVLGEKVPLIAAALPHIAHQAIRNRGTIGGSVALADPAAEMPALLLALNATVHADGPDGPRQIAADDFFLGLYDTDLNEGELVTGVSVPAAGASDRFGFYELARRHGDYAMVGVAVAWRSDVRIAFFSVADRAVRAPAAEAALAGGGPGAIDAAVAALDEIDFAGDLNAEPATKRHLAGVVLRRAIAGMDG